MAPLDAMASKKGNAKSPRHWMRRNARGFNKLQESVTKMLWAVLVMSYKHAKYAKEEAAAKARKGRSSNN